MIIRHNYIPFIVLIDCLKMCWCIHQHISIFSDKYKLAYVGAEEMLEMAQKIIVFLVSQNGPCSHQFQIPSYA